MAMGRRKGSEQHSAVGVPAARGGPRVRLGRLLGPLLALLPGLLLLAGPAAAWPGSVAQDGSLWPALEVIEDPQALWGPAEAAAQADAAWQRMPHPHTHFGTGYSAWWARARITAPAEQGGEWFLVHAQSFVDEVDLWQRREGGEWQAVAGLRDGARRTFSGARNPAFKLSLQAGESVDLLLRTQTLSLRRFPLQLLEEGSYYHQERQGYLLIGLIIAIPLVVSVFMLLLWQIQRDRGLLIIVALILSELVGALFVGGILAVLLPQLTPRTQGLIGMVGWVIAISMAHVHARYFLKLDGDAPRLARVFRAAPWVICACLGMEMAGWPVGRNVVILIAFCSAAAFFAASLWQAQRRLPYALVYAVAWGTYLLSAGLILINLVGTIPPNLSNLAMFAQGSVVSLIFAVAVVGQMRDRERRTQGELALSNQRFELAAAGAAVGLFDWNRREGRLFLSAVAARLLGSKPGQTRVRRFLRSLPPSSRGALLRWYRRLIAVPGESRLLELSIAGRPLLLSGGAMTDEAGLARVTGSVSDASRLRELEASRAQNRMLEEFRLLFDNASVGLYRADSTGQLLRANAAIGRWTAAEQVSWHAEPESLAELHQRLRADGEVVAFEYDARVHGETRPRRFSENARLAFIADDGRLVYEGAVQDISERYGMERALRDANARAQSAMEDRSRFFAATNHDLRQPLQSLGLLIELLRGQPLNVQLRQWVDRMSLSYASLADTLDGLMELSRMEAGALDVHLEEFALQPLLDQLANEYRLLAERKSLALSAVPTSLRVRSDRRLLERMLRNLLANAVRYTRSGRLLIGCRRRGAEVGIQVLDTGPGIDAQTRARMFAAYARGENGTDPTGRSDVGEGLGLGLAIVRSLGDALAHRIRVHSEPGRGSLFELRLPRVAGGAVPISAPADAEAALAGLAGLDIAVVDDQEEVGAALAAVLQASGAQVQVAQQAQAVCGPRGRPPDLLLLDYDLGGGDTGYAAWQRIQAHYARPLPVVLISGDPQAIPAAHAQAGRVLRKPVSGSRLRAAVHAALRQDAD